MMALSAGGRRAATCRPLKPPQEMPIMPTRPGAPGLAGDPGDHLERVVLLLLGVLVEHQAVGLAVAAHVDAHAGVAVAGEVGMRQGVALRGAVALAIGQVLEDRRHRLGLGVRRQPDALNNLGPRAPLFQRHAHAAGSFFEHTCCCTPAAAHLLLHTCDAPAPGLEAQTLRAALHGIIRDYARHSYRMVSEILEEADGDRAKFERGHRLLRS